MHDSNDQIYFQVQKVATENWTGQLYTTCQI